MHMDGKRRIATAVVPLGIPVALALWCTSAPQTAVAATQVPFEAQFSGSMHLSNSPTGFPVNVSGTGSASYLGRSTNSAHVTQINEPNSNCPTTGFVVLNHGVLTSSQDNDDQIDVTIIDHPCPVGPGLYSGSDSYVVTGGSGRFAGASGQGTFTGTGNFNNLTFTYTFSGTITAPNDDY